MIALQCQQARKHCIGHERGDAEKDEWEAERENGQHANFVRKANMRGMIRATVGAASPVAEQQAIEFRNDGTFTGARCKRKSH